jgi:hypothetical protein
MGCLYDTQPGRPLRHRWCAHGLVAADTWGWLGGGADSGTRLESGLRHQHDINHPERNRRTPREGRIRCPARRDLHRPPRGAIDQDVDATAGLGGGLVDQRADRLDADAQIGGDEDGLIPLRLHLGDSECQFPPASDATVRLSPPGPPGCSSRSGRSTWRARTDPQRAAAALVAGIQGGVVVLMATGRSDNLEAALDSILDHLKVR